MKQRNTDIDWIRSILIILMILIHIVNFGNAYPQLKAGILSFMMPTFLIITGYLVNIQEKLKGDGKIPDVSRFALRIMVTGFSVLSYFMPVEMASRNCHSLRFVRRYSLLPSVPIGSSRP